MKSLVALSLGVLIAAAMVTVGNSEPPPIPTPSPGEIEEPDLPTPDATPVYNRPGVLPRPDELPAHPQTDQPAKPAVARLSTRREKSPVASIRKVVSKRHSSVRKS